MTNELVLNATPLRTSQSYQINDLKIKLDIPETKEFNNVQFKNIEKITLKKSENTLLSNKIGLELQTNYSLNIIVPKYTKIDQNIELNFKLTEEALISKINIKYEQNSEANIIKKILSSLNSLASGLAELRNAYGSGHGKNFKFIGLEPRHADLVIGSSITLVNYLWSTFEWRKAKGKL